MVPDAGARLLFRIVPGIGQQSERVRDNTIECLAEHVCQVQGNADGKGFAEVGRRVLVTAYTMVVVMLMARMGVCKGGYRCSRCERSEKA